MLVQKKIQLHANVYEVGRGAEPLIFWKITVSKKSVVLVWTLIVLSAALYSFAQKITGLNRVSSSSDLTWVVRTQGGIPLYRPYEILHVYDLRVRWTPPTPIEIPTDFGYIMTGCLGHREDPPRSSARRLHSDLFVSRAGMDQVEKKSRISKSDVKMS